MGNKASLAMLRLLGWLAVLGVLSVGALTAMPAGLPQVGDDLVVIARDFADQGFTPHSTGIRNEWVGSEVFISSIGFQNNPEGVGFRLLICRGQPIGLSFNGNKTSVLLDANGDGRLDLELNGRLFVPFWVFDREDEGSGRSALFMELLDDLWAMFASDQGVDAGRSPFLGKYQVVLARFQNDTSLADRSLAYRVWFYNTTSQEFPLVARDALVGYAARLDGEVHPMVPQFLSEVSLRLNDRESARQLNHLVTAARPDFVPGQVLAARLLDDQGEREAAFARLKEAFPRHWLVKLY